MTPQMIKEEAARLFSYRFNYNEVSGADIENTFLAGAEFGAKPYRDMLEAIVKKWENESDSLMLDAQQLLYETPR